MLISVESVLAGSQSAACSADRKGHLSCFVSTEARELTSPQGPRIRRGMHRVGLRGPAQRRQEASFSVRDRGHPPGRGAPFPWALLGRAVASCGCESLAEMPWSDYRALLPLPRER